MLHRKLDVYRRTFVWFLLLTTLPLVTAPAAEPVKLSPLLYDEQGNSLCSVTAWLERRTQLREEWLQFLGKLPEQRAALNIEMEAVEKLKTHQRRYVKYEAEPGVVTDGWLLTPVALIEKQPAIVVFHQTTKQHAKQPAGIDDSQPELMQGVQLVEQGYVVWCPRCFIFEDGKSYLECVQQMRQQHPSWTGMTRMLWDAMRAADFLETLPEVDPQRIGCLGHSLGAKQVLYAAAFDERYRAIVFSEGGIGRTFSNWDAPWYLGAAGKHKEFKREHDSLLAMIAPRPFLLLGGDSADGKASMPFVDAVQPIYELFNAKENLIFVNHRQGHRYPLAAQQATADFFKKHLAKPIE